ncbi:DUF4192 domain-containing protein [Streptomyces sp. P38-E01]|uniref:DUF4192 domain-containing protein n=1 Tax=Streptomyces tardus TaxID=2780544 RepID=A0A949JKA0_9ACTN|nr:DUF4192 domain-containing protein [Streptomyces tardus]MBU7600314.1 DUF4192 domain-containing protein [Streptomyces tardus]
MSHGTSYVPPARTLTNVTLRGPAALADALPYLIGYHPDDSIVLIGLYGGRGRFGGRIRLGIPSVRAEWPDTAGQLADCLMQSGLARGERPDASLVYLCREPVEDDSSTAVKEQLRPLAEELRRALVARGMPVHESLFLSGGRYWTYLCQDGRCCPPEGRRLGPSGVSELAAATTYAGIRTRGSAQELTRRIAPLGPPRACRQEGALREASARLLPDLVTEEGRARIRERTLRLAARLRRRYLAASRSTLPVGPGLDDIQDDAILADEEAAELLVGLQDRVTRDRAAEWMEGEEAEPALRLWRALCRRCVGTYAEYGAPALALAGWVAWSGGDEPSARVALEQALRLDPRYTFAHLLHSACNRGLDPEPLRQCLRKQRADYERWASS